MALTDPSTSPDIIPVADDAVDLLPAQAASADVIPIQSAPDEDPYAYLKSLPRDRIRVYAKEALARGESVSPYAEAFIARAREGNLLGDEDRSGETPSTPFILKNLELVKRGGQALNQFAEGVFKFADNLTRAAGYGVVSGIPLPPRYAVDPATGKEFINPAQAEESKRLVDESMAAVQLGTGQSLVELRRAANNLANWAYRSRGPMTEEDRKAYTEQFMEDLAAEEMFDRVRQGKEVAGVKDVQTELTPEAEARRSKALEQSRVAGLPLQQEVSPEAIEQMAPAADLSNVVPFEKAFSSVLAASKGAKAATVLEQAAKPGLVARGLSNTAKSVSNAFKAAEKTVETSPLIGGISMAGAAAAAGADPSGALLAGLLGANTRRLGVAKATFGKVSASADRISEKLLGQVPPGPIGAFAISSFRAVEPAFRGAVAAQLANTPFLFGSQSEEEFADAFAGAAALGAAGGMSARAIHGLNAAQGYFLGRKNGLPEARVQAKNLGVDPELDAGHLKVLKTLNNASHNLVELWRQNFKKQGKGEAYTLFEPDYETALDKVVGQKTVSEDGQVQTVTPDWVAAAKRQAGVTLNLVGEDGQPRRVQFTKVSPAAPGIAFGHELGELLWLDLSPEERAAWSDGVRKAYSSEDYEAYRQRHEALVNQGAAPGDRRFAISDEDVARETFAEHASAVLNSIPVGEFSPAKNPQEIIRLTYGLVGRVLENLGAKQPKMVGAAEGDVPTTGLGIEPSVKLSGMVENFLKARELDGVVKKQPETTELPPLSAVPASAAPLPTPEAPKPPIQPWQRTLSGKPPTPTATPTAQTPNLRATTEQQGQFATTASPEIVKQNVAALKADEGLPRSERRPVETDYFAAKSPVSSPDQVVREAQRRAADAAEKDGAPNPLRQAFQKIFVPYGPVRDSKAGKPTVFGMSLDKVVQNVDLLQGWLRLNPNGPDASVIRGYLGSPEIVSDLQGYLRNQAHGYAGDGRKLTLPADARDITPSDPNYTPVQLDPAKAQVLNLLMGMEQPQKETPGQAFARRFAEQNGVTVAEINGVSDTNSLRARLRAQGFDPRILNAVVENLRVDRMATPLKPRPDLNFSAGDTGIQRAGFMPQPEQEWSPTHRGVDFNDKEARRIARGYDSGEDTRDPAWRRWIADVARRPDEFGPEAVRLTPAELYSRATAVRDGSPHRRKSPDFGDSPRYDTSHYRSASRRIFASLEPEARERFAEQEMARNSQVNEYLEAQEKNPANGRLELAPDRLPTTPEEWFGSDLYNDFVLKESEAANRPILDLAHDWSKTTSVGATTGIALTPELKKGFLAEILRPIDVGVPHRGNYLEVNVAPKEPGADSITYFVPVRDFGLGLEARRAQAKALQTRLLKRYYLGEPLGLDWTKPKSGLETSFGIHTPWASFMPQAERAADEFNRWVSGQPGLTARVIPTGQDEPSVNLSWIKADPQGSGLGTKAMEKLAEIADRNGVDVRLYVEGEQPERLAAWYQKLGYEQDGPRMVRKPSSLAAPRFMPAPKTDTPEFKKWFGASKVVDEDGEPLVVYHGTTHDFTKFDKSRAQLENDFGQAFYFSNTPEDVGSNYSTAEGPDITIRIESRAEQIASRLEEENPAKAETYEGRRELFEQAKQIARSELTSHGGAILPVYLSLKNPAQLGGPQETYLSLGYRGGKYIGNLGKVFEGFRDAGKKYLFDPEKVIGTVLETALDREGIVLSGLLEQLKKSEELMWAEDRDEGTLVHSEVIRHALEFAGYDGIIDYTVNRKFGSESMRTPMRGMDENTVHYIAFKPTQVKSAIANTGKFSSRNPDIRFMPQPARNKFEGVPLYHGTGSKKLASGKAKYRSSGGMYGDVVYLTADRKDAGEYAYHASRGSDFEPGAVVEVAAELRKPAKLFSPIPSDVFDQINRIVEGERATLPDEPGPSISKKSTLDDAFQAVAGADGVDPSPATDKINDALKAAGYDGLWANGDKTGVNVRGTDWVMPFTTDKVIRTDNGARFMPQPEKAPKLGKKRTDEFGDTVYPVLKGKQELGTIEPDYANGGFRALALDREDLGTAETPADAVKFFSGYTPEPAKRALATETVATKLGKAQVENLTPTGWVLPDGSYAGISAANNPNFMNRGDFHSGYLSDRAVEMKSKFGLELGKAEDIRLAALNKGFIRVRLDGQTGRMGVEANPKFLKGDRLAKLQDVIEENANRIGKLDVNLFNDKGEVVGGDAVDLFRIDDPQERSAAVLEALKPSRSAAPRFMPQPEKTALDGESVDRLAGGMKSQSIDKVVPNPSEFQTLLTELAKDYDSKIGATVPRGYFSRIADRLNDLRGLTREENKQAQQIIDFTEAAAYYPAEYREMLRRALAQPESAPRFMAQPEGPRSATLDDFKPENLALLPTLSSWAILTAANPDAKQLSPEANAARMASLKDDLKAIGATFVDAEGKYGNVEPSLLVTGITPEQAQTLGNKYGQDSVITPQGMVYKDGSYNPLTGKVTVHEKAPEDFYTKVPSLGSFFTLDLDFNETRKPEPKVGDRMQSPLELEDAPAAISSRLPTAKKATEDGLAQQLTIRAADVMADSENVTTIGNLLKKYPGLPAKGKAKDLIKDLHDLSVANLLWLHDKMPKEIRDRSKLWYEGGRKLVERWSQEHNLPRPAVAGVLASLSPQKDWFMNVDLARRVIEHRKELQNKELTDGVVEWFDAKFGDKAPENVEVLREGVGKKFSELSPYQRAVFLRAYDEITSPRSYQIITPEGNFSGPAKNQNGALSKVAWGDFGTIAKAVSILEDPSRANISARLGFEHKVRSFNNNLLVPNESKQRDVTIDTHAVAAALLRPLAGGDIPVVHNFGGAGVPSSALTGASGLYGIYADAYREAADARNLLPREMQSITWEAVRALFTPEFKNATNKAKVDAIWNQYRDKKITLDEARNQIFALAGGIRTPSWALSSP